MAPIHHLVAIKYMLSYLGNEDLASFTLVHSSYDGIARQTLDDTRGVEFKPTPATNETKVTTDTVVQAIKTGDLETCKARCTRSKALQNIHEACFYGHLHVVKWLAVTFGLISEHTRSIDNYTFYVACKNGHLHVAKWLHETFHFTTLGEPLVHVGACPV
jgi:hypothetical protein